MEELDCVSDKLKECQALNQFREWIEKDSKIKKCRTDDQFLIRFLRMRKFNIQEAYQLLVKYLTTRKQLPHLFENLNIEDPELEIFVTCGSSFELPGLDSQGRIIFSLDSRKLEGRRWRTVDCARMQNLIFEYLSINEKAQTKGVVLVIDASSQNYEFLRLWTPVTIKELVRCAEKTYPVRLKKIYIVNLAPLWSALVHILMIFISDKIKRRIEFIQGWDEVLKELGMENFPQEIGGVIPASEMAEAFRKRLLENQENILSHGDSDIEISYSSRNFTNSSDAELDAGIVGSFRKIVFD